MVQSVVRDGVEAWDVSKNNRTNYQQPKWITYEGTAGEQDQIEYGKKR